MFSCDVGLLVLHDAAVGGDPKEMNPGGRGEGEKERPDGVKSR